jgi:UDP-N-acetylmuramoyl-L-alanyl-D-glutamate--2,6-diaminopimelate ligase
VCASPRQILGELSAWYFDYPFKKLTSVGITGTNGKTTTTDLINQLWELNSISSGLIGTLGTRFKANLEPGTRTTPEANELQQVAAQMVKEDIKHLVMEVSSHAIDQLRIKGCRYKVAGFTNLTQDHLDYHINMENYFEAKAALFTEEYAEQAVINIDNSYGVKLLKITKIPTVTISRIENNADWNFSKLISKDFGYEVEIKSKFGNHISGAFGLKGEFNLDNLLLAVVSASLTGLSDLQISNSLSKLKSVPGRLEQISLGQEFTALVDYAHTPDAVERVLKTVKNFTTGKVISVLGCGGQRDKSKRPLMGAALFNGSDLPIFTSDNPRGESVEQILEEMTHGLDVAVKGSVISDRREAIVFACQQAKAGDCVIVLGKGHEIGQEISGTIYPFDDRIELANAIKQVISQ